MSPQWVVSRLGILEHEYAARFAVSQSYAVLLDEFRKEGKDEQTTRTNVTDFLIQHTAPRYELYNKFAPLHFSDLNAHMRDAMVVALICDSCLSHMNPHNTPSECSANLVFDAYAIQEQAENLIEGNAINGPVMPESLFLSQIEALGNLAIIHHYLPHYNLSEIQKLTHKPVLDYAHLIDVSSPAGRALHDIMSAVIEGVERRLSQYPDLTIVS